MNSETSRSNQLADDFKENFTGKLSKDAVKHIAEGLKKITESKLEAATSYGASGSLVSLIFYIKAQCNINGGKSFNGDAGGISIPGGGALIGDVYLENASTLDELYTKTSGFAFTATPVYTAFYFLDSNNIVLGHFQAGSVSTVAGAGGGSGGWS